tara:strand:- start:202 stop:759 length:558 start_codon:yes stop_codon:yes gene_type:complete
MSIRTIKVELDYKPYIVVNSKTEDFTIDKKVLHKYMPITFGGKEWMEHCLRFVNRSFICNPDRLYIKNTREGRTIGFIFQYNRGEFRESPSSIYQKICSTFNTFCNPCEIGKQYKIYKSMKHIPDDELEGYKLVNWSGEVGKIIFKQKAKPKPKPESESDSDSEPEPIDNTSTTPHNHIFPYSDD